MTRPVAVLALATLAILGSSVGAAAQERLCDPQFEDCRTPLLELIRNETQRIDMACWQLEDARYVTELIKRHQAGVAVRILIDQRASVKYSENEKLFNTLRDAGIPMREKIGADILHFKMMLFHGQNVVEFSKANYAPGAFVPLQPYVNYFDETVFFTDDDNLTNSFRRRFDDLWINTSQYRNFANITAPLERVCPTCTIHPSMNFVPLQSFSSRAVSRYDRENERIDALVFRVTDYRQADAMIRAVQRNVPVRLITEPDEYRNEKKLWHSKHIDRMYMAGVQIKQREHEGVTHQASVVLRGLGEVIFGSANWSDASGFRQDEHNYFYNPSLGKPWFYQWFADQFVSKWNDTANYVPFVPLPPGVPTNISPLNQASGLPTTTVTLSWDGGVWAHLYDIYLDTNPQPAALVAANVELGSANAGVLEKFTVSGLQPGTTYYWRIVGKTWAQMRKNGPIWSFTTSGTPPVGGGTPYGGTPVVLPGVVQAENFDVGAAGVAYNDVTTGNSGNVYRTTNVDIGQTSDPSSNGYYVGWTRTGEWLKYSVDVTETRNYALHVRVANAGSGARFRVEVDGVDVTGSVSVPNTGAWDAWQTVSLNVPLTAGQRVIRLVMVGSNTQNTGVGNYGYLWFQ